MEDRFKFRTWYTPIYSCEDDEKQHYVYDIEQIYDGYTNKGHSELGWISSFGSLLDGDEYIIEQCTGLTDRNGKLIYEGDILKCVHSEIMKYKVYWARCGYRMKVYGTDNKLVDDTVIFLDTSTLEVIGNIHENPDLVTGEE